MKKYKKKKTLLKAQRNELSEYQIFKWLASRISDGRNREILKRITDEEYNRYHRETSVRAD